MQVLAGQGEKARRRTNVFGKRGYKGKFCGRGKSAQPSLDQDCRGGGRIRVTISAPFRGVTKRSMLKRLYSNPPRRWRVTSDGTKEEQGGSGR